MLVQASALLEFTGFWLGLPQSEKPNENFKE